MDLNTFVTFSIIGELTTVWEEMDLILPYLSLICNGKKSPFRIYVVSQLWNKLPLKVRQAANPKDFKQNLMTVEL